MAANRLKNQAMGIKKAITTGMRRIFNTISEEKIKRMMEVTYQERIEAKLRWAVKLYREWSRMRVDQSDCDLNIVYADLDDVASLTKENFEYLMCRFICEVRKAKENADFPGRTLYQIVCSIQNFLRKRDINWKLVHNGNKFCRFQHVLDNVMKERVSRNIGAIRKQAQVISMRHEEQLWERGVLCQDTPEKLRETVLFVLGVNLALHAGDEHYALWRINPQITFEYNSLGVRCMVYSEDTVTKTNRGGLSDMKKERKAVWVKPSENWQRCPVRIVEKYMNLLPLEGKKANFYLQSLKKIKPNCWYSIVPVGINSLRKVVASLLKDAGLDGFFTNHSLRRTCATCLFQAGKDVKIIKEITGHVSDAVQKYQCTSDEQRMSVSDVIQKGIGNVPKLSEASEMHVVEEKSIDNNTVKFAIPKLKLPIKCIDVEADANSGENETSVSQMIENAIKVVGKCKAKVTIELDLNESNSEKLPKCQRNCV